MVGLEVDMVSLLSGWENRSLYPGLGIALAGYTTRLLTACQPLNRSRESRLYTMSLGNHHPRQRGERSPHPSFLLQPEGFDFFAHEPEVPLRTPHPPVPLDTAVTGYVL